MQAFLKKQKKEMQRDKEGEIATQKLNLKKEVKDERKKLSEEEIEDLGYFRCS